VFVRPLVVMILINKTVFCLTGRRAFVHPEAPERGEGPRPTVHLRGVPERFRL
jgi:hypothetical protein